MNTVTGNLKHKLKKASFIIIGTKKRKKEFKLIRQTLLWEFVF